MAKKTTKKLRTRTATAKVVGVVPYALHNGFAWRVRLMVPRFPFFIDSGTCYRSLEAANAEVEKWKKRKVVVSVTK